MLAKQQDRGNHNLVSPVLLCALHGLPIGPAFFPEGAAGQGPRPFSQAVQTQDYFTSALANRAMSSMVSA